VGVLPPDPEAGDVPPLSVELHDVIANKIEKRAKDVSCVDNRGLIGSSRQAAIRRERRFKGAFRSVEDPVRLMAACFSNR